MLFSRFGFAAVAFLVSLAGLSVVTPSGGVSVASWLVGCTLIAASISLVSRALLTGSAGSTSAWPSESESLDRSSSGPILARPQGPDPSFIPMLAVSPLVFLSGMLIILGGGLLR